MADPPPVSRRRGVARDALLVLVVAGLGAKAALGIGAARDVDLADEGSYALVAVGASATGAGLPDVEGSPLYILWERALLRGGVPLDALTHASWGGLAVLLPVSVFVLARACGAGPVAALAGAGFVPATTLIDIWPYPLHLAAAVLALGTALAVRLPRAAGCAALGLTLLVACYVRPEFWYALLAFLPVAAGALAAGALGAAALGLALGSPKPDGARAVAALGQHYALNLHRAGGPVRAPWNEWEEHYRTAFGEATGVFEALRANPTAFGWHVGQNARQVPGTLLSAAVPRIDLTYLPLPHQLLNGPEPPHADVESAAARALAAAVGLGLLGALCGLRAARRGSPDGAALPLAALALVLVAAPALAAALVVFPRPHYAVPTLALAAALAAAGFRHLPGARPTLGPRGTLVALALVATVLGFVVPNRAKGVCAQARLWKHSGGQQVRPVPTPARAAIRALRALGLPPETVCLETTNGFARFAGLTAAPVNPFAVSPNTGLLELVRRANVGVVLLEPILLGAPALAGDPEVRELAAGRDTERFRSLPVPGYPVVRLAVRRDLLPE